MKKLRSIVILALLASSIVLLAQTVKKDINSSIGNGAMMENNLNEPNATVPAMNNNQKYEKDGVMLGANIHPDKSLSNSYDRHCFEEKKSEEKK